MSKMLLRRRAFSTATRGGTNVRAFFEKNPDAAEAVPLLVFVSTGEWFFTFFFFCISLNILNNKTFLVQECLPGWRSCRDRL